MLNQAHFINDLKEGKHSLTTLLCQKEKKKEEYSFYYQREILNICDDNQKLRFNKIFNDATINTKHPNKPRKEN